MIITIIHDYQQTFIFLKTFNSDVSYIEVWLTNKNSKVLEIKVKINITY